MKDKVLVTTHNLLATSFAKTCHGLLRGGDRYEVLAVIDTAHVGKDAGMVMDGTPVGIKVFESVNDFLAQSNEKPKYCIVGVAPVGGQLPKQCRDELITAINNGLSIVCGLHQFLNNDVEFQEIAKTNGVELIDVRKPRPTSELAFWSGDIYSVKTPKIAVLGMDCAVGKRTTCRYLMEACKNNGIKAEMIYTGQTGWMQGYKHGFIFDSTTNDFIGGEVERSIVECDRELSPDLILIEGQASLRNPSGPCGSEFLLSGNVKGVFLQHAPGREFFAGLEDKGCRLPSVESEIDLIRAYGAQTLAVTLNEEGWDNSDKKAFCQQMAEKLSIPVVRPLVDGVDSLIPVIQSFMMDA